MWEILPEVRKKQNLPGLLPLLPLAQGGDSREVVEDMIDSLQQAGRTDLLPLGYILSGYRFTEESEQQWLRERFHKMKGMFEGNWAYQDMVQWAEEKGMKQGLERGLEQGLERGVKRGAKKELQTLRTTLIHFVQAHFPDQLSLAKRQVKLTTTPEQVQEILDKLFVARTGDEVREILLAIPHA